jgi:hypothetical protein
MITATSSEFNNVLLIKYNILIELVFDDSVVI